MWFTLKDLVANVKISPSDPADQTTLFANFWFHHQRIISHQKEDLSKITFTRTLLIVCALLSNKKRTQTEQKLPQ